MLRTLYIVRHAKAEDKAIFQRDHDRELVPSGIMAAARVGRYLRGRNVTADYFVSSTAPRARDTAKVIAEQLQIDPGTIVLDADLYDGGMKAYLAAVNRIPDEHASAMIFGHNPDISYFAEYLTHRTDVNDMDKGAVVAVTFEGLRWREVSGRTGTMAFAVSPKDLPTAEV